jgi:tetratricopeptide (TPR) repeat protein
MTSMAEENKIVPDARPQPGTPGSEPASEPPEAAQAESAPAPEPPSSADSSSGAGPRPSAGLTPGQRLALKRDKKAQQKKEFKAELKRDEEAEAAREQEEAERVLGYRRPAAAPDAVQEVATEFTGYVQGHRGRIVGAVLGVLALGFVFVLGRNYMSAGSAEQAERLASAIELADAPLDPADDDGKGENDKPVFKSAADRTSKASEAFASAAKLSSDSLAGSWARLGQAGVLLAAGKADQAVPLFQQSLTAHKDDPVVGARALEGLAIALEASGKRDEALKRFQELKSFDGGAHKDVAEYHIARLKLAQGDRDGAKALLKDLYDRLSAPAEGAPRSRFLKGEVEARLSELDSSLVPAGGGEAQQFSPEELQRLIQQIQQKGGVPPGGRGE